MSESILSVEKLVNGYTVSVQDSKIIAANKKPNSTYQDPCKEYAFTTSKDVAAFVAKNLDSLPPPMSDDEMYDEAFGSATKGGNDD